MKTKIALVVCCHGDEKKGFDAVKYLSPEALELADVFIGNPAAMAVGKRFIQSDLNRCFPGNLNGNIEERIAAKLSVLLKDYDCVIDVHTTAADTIPFIILTTNSAPLSVASCAPLDTVVVMPSDHGRGGCLIDNVNGFSLEFPESMGTQAIANTLDTTIKNLAQGVSLTKKVVYRGVRSQVFDSPVENFKQVKGYFEGNEPLYAVLSGARSYRGKTILAIKEKESFQTPEPL